ncbi:sodium-dependent transporter [Marinospirillum alkaliphilum]|uniref:Transporter n=1 Tax=Marinospirillum alkaliphilum DSM 21637 TaxID=1122209 RepID=A0A1K1Y5F9_9GAMM|nr:sodium-dependent transporter [Marinospirillum alkaliphilum]SFX56581.1 neurotransmitter:Na+ symporter, NSS family [Marinospirillum alkaliphilum DSM 21637]
MTTANKVHAQWSSRMGFVLAATGSAVGLGNIWKFPYMVGDSGGAAFVLIYLACIFLIGLPILVGEWLLGRRGQKNPIHTMQQLAADNHRSRVWVLVGLGGVLAAFLILSFYSVIGGWSLAYIKDAVTGNFSGQDGDGIGAIFGGLLASPGLLIFWHSLFMLITIGIVARGVTGGLEAAARTLMPALGVLLVLLVIYGMTTGGFMDALAFMFKPDWSQLNGGIVLAALGHAFFTLSLGMGIMMAYGSYLGEDVSLLQSARTVVIMDTVIALAAGLAIFPIVFANGLDLGQGPGLIFVTLPVAFGNITAGWLVGVAFFVLLTFAAIASAISLLEPVVEFVEERTPLSRMGATLVSGVAAWALGILALLSFNVLSDFTLLGLGIFDLLDTLTSKFLLPLTGLGVILFVAWCLDKEQVRQELGLDIYDFSLWNLIARYIAPIGVLVVFFANL